MSKEWNKLNAATRLIFQSSSSSSSSPKQTAAAASKDRLRVFVGTWNMYGRLLPIDLATILSTHQQDNNNQDEDNSPRYHIIAIGTQECERDISESLLFPSKEIWEKRLSDFLGNSYTMLKTETLAALHLAIFVWTPLVDRVQSVRCNKIKTGWANMIGNKGAVAVSLQFGSRKLLFINCHLRAHQANLSERNANVERILHELDFDNCKHEQSARQSTMSLLRRLSRRATRAKPKEDKVAIVEDAASKSVLDEFDHVFFFGDTNYRINADRPWVLERIKNEDYQSLLKFDQLLMERSSGNCPLAPFKEHPINFPPTYKLDAMASPPISPASSSTSSSYKDWFSTYTSASQKSSISKHSSSPASPPPPVPPLPPSIKSDTNAVVAASSSSRQPPKHSESVPSTPPAAKIPTTTKQQRSQSTPETPGSQVSAAELVYDTSPKQRIPSWTDRILWYDRDQQQQGRAPSVKTTSTSKLRLRFTLPSRNKASYVVESRETVCYRYEAILDGSLVGVSDHMPVVGEFGIYFNEWQPEREQPKKRPFWISRKKSQKAQ